MILMNYYSAKSLNNEGIYRISSLKNSDIDNINEITINENNKKKKLPNDIKHFLTYWKNTESFYCLERKKHDSLNLDSYVHITSPIRRLIDILNMFKLQNILNIPDYTNNANEFYEKWFENINYIDKTFKSIKKIQKNCLLLHTCLNDSTNNENKNKNNNINKKKYIGYLISKNIIEKITEYQIYIQELKLVSKIKSNEDFQLFKKYVCEIFIFNDESSLQNKIRIKIVC